MVLEGADSSFCAIASMHVGRHKLELGTPGKRDGLFESRAGLVVHNL
jgi:hypothetical protein